MEKWYEHEIALYESLSKCIKEIIEENLKDEKITIHGIETRIKEKNSFLEKIKIKNYKNPEIEMTDIAGIRIITYVNSDVDKISKLIEELFKVDNDNSLDKSKLLGEDKVGYKSVHYIGMLNDDRLKLREFQKYKNKKFEIQVRTILQHAWAEIEHDKNYKFSGVLPSEIKRRFKILAGLLEVADNEFNNLATEIDEYGKTIKEKTLNDDLNIEINTTTLEEFLFSKFSDVLDTTDKTLKNYNIIDEVKRFGIKSISELSNTVPKNLLKNMIKIQHKTTLLGMIRDILIINDYNKYFENAWENAWGGTDSESLKLWGEYNLPIKKILNDYNIAIEQEDFGYDFDFDDK